MWDDADTDYQAQSSAGSKSSRLPLEPGVSQRAAKDVAEVEEPGKCGGAPGARDGSISPTFAKSGGSWGDAVSASVLILSANTE
jgi:hypothetical protein